MRHSLRPATSAALLLLLPLIDCGRWEQTGPPPPPTHQSVAVGAGSKRGVSWPVANAASLKNVAIATFRGNKKREEGKRGAEEKEGELSSSAF